MSEAVAILVIIFGHFTAYLLALYSLAIYIDPDEVKSVVPGLAPRRKNFLLRLADNPRSFKRVAVVYKSLALILITTMTGFLAVKLAVSAGVSPAWVIVPALLLVWTGYILLIEYLPRSMSRRAIKPSMMRWVWLIAAIYYLCYPMLWLYHRAMGRSRDDTPVTEEEKEELVERAIETLADEAGIGETIVEEEEKEMIGQIFLLDQTVAREIMVPRMDITAIDKSMSFKEIREIVLKDGHSRYPVYDGAIDKIIGLIYVKDLFNKMPEPGENFNIDQYLRKPYFVHETKVINKLLKEFKTRQSHIAIVVDEYGGVAGLVTLEDIIEEIFGEIQDEHDAEIADISPLADGQFLVNASLLVEDLQDHLDTDYEQGDYDTVGGLIYDLVGSVPSEGQRIKWHDLEFEVERVEGQRILTVKVRR